jgi:TIR domain
MKVFISWSGTLSKYVAEELKSWLPCVLWYVEPYVSSDTLKGGRWRDTVARELESSDYGILCVTPENISSEWLHFEAGALSKKMEASYVSPFLVRVSPNGLTHGPLSQFQATVHYDYDDVLKLVKSIDRAAGNKLDEGRIDQTFKVWWPKLKDPLEKIVREHFGQNRSEGQWGSEEILSELLVLARSHERILADVRASRPMPTSDVWPRVLNGVDFTEIGYTLRQLQSVADEAVESTTSETRNHVVQLRGLIGVLMKRLSPAIDAPKKHHG